jgi:hypothetical protein
VKTYRKNRKEAVWAEGEVRQWWRFNRASEIHGTFKLK